MITTKRAYDELEQEGFFYAVARQRLFSWRRRTPSCSGRNNLKKIEGHLSEVRRLAASVHLTREDLREMLALMWEDEL